MANLAKLHFNGLWVVLRCHVGENPMVLGILSSARNEL